jgi:hypothetical protein
MPREIGASSLVVLRHWIARFAGDDSEDVTRPSAYSAALISIPP